MLINAFLQDKIAVNDSIIMNKSNDISSVEYLKELQIKLANVIDTIAPCIQTIPNVKDDVSMAFSFMAGPILDTSNSILILSEAGKMRDSYALARMIFDQVLNLGYFGVKGDEGVKKALNHYHQKTYRDLDREINIKGTKFGIKLKDINKVKIPENLKKAINYYTNKKGLEIRSWTNENVFKKIELIQDKYGKDIGMLLIINLFFIYRHASEIIHGTLYSCFFNRGITMTVKDHPKNLYDLKVYHRRRINFVLINVILLNHVMFEIIHYHFPDKEKIKILHDIITYIEIPY